MIYENFRKLLPKVSLEWRADGYSNIWLCQIHRVYVTNCGIRYDLEVRFVKKVKDPELGKILSDFDYWWERGVSDAV